MAQANGKQGGAGTQTRPDANQPPRICPKLRAESSFRLRQVRSNWTACTWYSKGMAMFHCQVSARVNASQCTSGNRSPCNCLCATMGHDGARRMLTGALQDAAGAPQDLGFTVVHEITTLFPDFKGMETNKIGGLSNVPRRPQYARG